MPRSLFDGTTLNGWRPVPRLSTPLWPGGPHPEGQPDVAKAARTSGRWEVVDGAIVGGQEIQGLGGYLLSEEVFADFELSFEIKPDWPADTGVVLRATERGSQGFQVLVDYRKSGAIGGFYGNGIGAFHASAFNVDLQVDESGSPEGLRIETEETTLEPVSTEQVAQLAHHIEPERFLDVWNWGDWNRITVRCEGSYPVLTSWINGVKAYQIDTGTMSFPHYDREAALRLLGRAGHLALEVHDNEWPGMGKARWAPGAVVRWRDITIEEFTA